MFKRIKSWFGKSESDFQIPLHKFKRKYPHYRDLCEHIATVVRKDLIMEYVVGSKMGSHLPADSQEYKLIQIFKERQRFQANDNRFQRFNYFYRENLLRTLRGVYLELFHTHKSQLNIRNILFDPQIESSLAEAGFDNHEIKMMTAIFMPPKLNLILTYHPQDSMFSLLIKTEENSLLHDSFTINT